MGIYDRDYVRSNPNRGWAAGGGGRGPGLGARARMLSVTMWLIIINVAVFIVGGFLVNNGVQVKIKDVYFETPPERVAIQPDFYTNDGPFVNGLPVPGPGRVIVPVTTEQGAVRYRVFTALPPERARRADSWNFISTPIFEITDQGAFGRVVGVRSFRVMDPLGAVGHFSTQKGFLELGVWRLVTFQFLHSGLTHLLFNMFGLWFFGLQVEQNLGRKRYLAFYLMCGICGGLLYLFFNLIGTVGLNLPGALHVEVTTPLIGASAGVFGVLMACAFLVPNERIRLLLLPFWIRTKVFAYGYCLFAALNLFILEGQNQGGDAAHVGGALGGYFFIRHQHLLRDFFDVFQDSRKPKRVGGPRMSGGRKNDRNQQKIDKILDKISREGLKSLSEREKRFLQESSKNLDEGFRG